MLYIINKSHANSQALDQCLQRASEGDAVLLIEHAVYSALDTKQTPLARLDRELDVFVLSPDMQTRGLEKTECLGFIQYTDYQGFVELVATNAVVRSCF